jgi:hypothetical protein
MCDVYIACIYSIRYKAELEIVKSNVYEFASRTVNLSTALLQIMPINKILLKYKTQQLQNKLKQVKRNRNRKGQGAHTHKLERKCMISTTTQIKNT